jgi:hypothetical protein
MNFQEAGQRHAELKALLQSGQLQYEQYEIALQELRVTDENGDWWQIDPGTDGWLRWDGQAWTGSLPHPAGVGASSIPGAAPCPACRRPLAPGVKFCRACGTRVSAGYGPRQTRESMAACPNCGAGVPLKLKFCTRCGSPLARAGQAGAAQRVGDLQNEVSTSRFLKWNQRIWDLVSMAGCTAMALAWFVYSGQSNAAAQAVDPRRSEPGADVGTSVAMVLVPLALIVFRPVTDRLLMPLQKLRSKIPPLFLLGAGLAVPLVISNYLFTKYAALRAANGSGQGYEYEFILNTFLWSVMISYVILRNPVPRGDSAEKRGFS